MRSIHKLLSLAYWIASLFPALKAASDIVGEEFAALACCNALPASACETRDIAKGRADDQPNHQEQQVRPSELGLKAPGLRTRTVADARRTDGLGLTEMLWLSKRASSNRHQAVRNGAANLLSGLASKVSEEHQTKEKHKFFANS